MRLNGKIVCANLLALAVNTLFLFLAILKVCPAILPIAVFVGCLIGLVLLSGKINGLALWPIPHKRKDR